MLVFPEAGSMFLCIGGTRYKLISHLTHPMILRPFDTRQSTQIHRRWEHSTCTNISLTAFQSTIYSKISESGVEKREKAVLRAESCRTFSTTKEVTHWSIAIFCFILIGDVSFGSFFYLAFCWDDGIGIKTEYEERMQSKTFR